MLEGQELADLENHMAEVARLQFDTYHDLSPRLIDLDRVWRKRFSLVHRYRVEGEHGTESFFVKAPFASPSRGHIDSGRLIAAEPTGSKAVLQRAALDDLAAAVDGSQSARLGAVRVLPGGDDRVVVMTAGRGEPVRHAVLQQVRWHRPHRDLDPVFERVGSLLRLFHEGVQRPEVPAVLVDRDDLASRCLELLSHVGEITSATSSLDQMGERLLAAIESHLPERMGVATRFGDFGLTNLLVTDDGTVTAIDTLGALRAPPLHDATYFVTAVTSLRPQLITRGRSIRPATVDGWLQSFWNGYLGAGAMPTGAVETWCCVRLLERWAAKSTRASSSSHRYASRLVVDRPMLGLIDRSLSIAERTQPQPELVDIVGAP